MTTTKSKKQDDTVLPQFNNKPGGVSRVETTTLQERVYQELRSALMRGHFQPGQPITIRWLAEQVGTSVMPVREAIQRLVAERALQLLPNRAVRVPVLDHQTLSEVYRIRAILEGEAAELACSHMSKQEIAQLRNIQNKMDHALATHDIVTFLEANQEFHFAVYLGAKTNVLMPIIESLWLSSGPMLRAAYADIPRLNTHLASAVAYHHAAIDALAHGGGAAARAALMADIRAGGDWVIQEVATIARRTETHPLAPGEVLV